MRCIALGSIVLLLSTPVRADEIPQTMEQPGGIDLVGSARGGYWSSSRNLNDETGLTVLSLWFKTKPKLGADASLTMEGWASHENSDSKSHGLLREGYLSFGSDSADLRIGKQIIVWGRADRLNPTDNLTPRDFTLLVPEDDDQYLGSLAAKATYYFENLSLTGIWLPDFKPNKVPIRQSPALNFREQIPDTHRQWAIKLEQSGKAVDWSLSYFDGIDLNPDIGIDSVTSGDVNLLLSHHRIRVIGADAATVIGRYGLRAEAAYTSTEDSEGNDPEIKNPFFYMVLGVERNLMEGLNINVQYFTRRVSHYSNPEQITDPLQRSVAIQQAVVSNQLDRVQHGISLRVSDKWFNDTLEAEVAGVKAFTRGDYVIRPKLTYAFSDRSKGVIGIDLFRGADNTFYGRLRDNSTLYGELRYSF